jgi:uncharacterized protein
LVLPDVNVLLYAFHPAAERHGEHKVWLDSLINGEVEFGLSPQVLNSVVRIGTNNTAFRPPYHFDHVAAFCDDLMAAPMRRMIQPGRRHWRLFCDLCRKTGARGNLAQDAWFAIANGSRMMRISVGFRGCGGGGRFELKRHLTRCLSNFVSDDASQTPPVRVGAPWTLSPPSLTCQKADNDDNAPTLTGGV